MWKLSSFLQGQHPPVIAGLPEQACQPDTTKLVRDRSRKPKAYSVPGMNPTFNLFSKIIVGLNPTNCSRSLRAAVRVGKGPDNRIFRI